MSTVEQGIPMLNMTALVQSKLWSFYSRGALKDFHDLTFLIESYSADTHYWQMDENLVQFFVHHQFTQQKGFVNQARMVLQGLHL